MKWNDGKERAKFEKRWRSAQSNIELKKSVSKRYVLTLTSILNPGNSGSSSAPLRSPGVKPKSLTPLFP